MYYGVRVGGEVYPRRVTQMGILERVGIAFVVEEQGVADTDVAIRHAIESDAQQLAVMAFKRAVRGGDGSHAVVTVLYLII